MLNRERFISELVDDVRCEMKTNIECGFDYMYYEKEYGTATVCVDVTEYRQSNGMYNEVTDVYVTHEGEQQSPLLEALIRQSIPNWMDVKREVNENDNERDYEDYLRAS